MYFYSCKKEKITKNSHIYVCCIISNRRGTWNVYDLRFYPSKDCLGEKYTKGKPESSSYDGSFIPNNALDNDSKSMWSGRNNNNDGQLWLGLNFGKDSKLVQCVSMKQSHGEHGANTVIVQAFVNDKWINAGKGIDMNRDEEVFIGLVSCSCSEEDNDLTGMPRDLKATQNMGQVTFNFKDNSKCEDSFSFSRRIHGEEEISFTRDYFYTGRSQCDNKRIAPGLDAHDSLSLSNLIVGKTYEYLVRAAAPRYNVGVRSSGPTIIAHKINWEASIHGKVTTNPYAGSLPIKDVEVSWQLYDANDQTMPIECTGCSGKVDTHEGGSFEIPFNIDHRLLYNNNEKEFPVKITFAKKSGNIVHTFLCNNGEDDCSGEIGTNVFVKHLQFKVPLDVYDDTSVPFSGKAFIEGTEYSGSDGCMLQNVQVCLLEERSNGGLSKTNSTLVCGKTKPDGTYSLPIIIGSRVDYVDLLYHEHVFRPSSKSKFEKGMVIEEGRFYDNNDFEDIGKARVIVDIVGGLCERNLGNSVVHMKIVGCNWNKIDPNSSGSYSTYTQTETRKFYNSVPAHLLDIQVLDLTDGNDKRIEHMYNFFQGKKPLVRTIDLRDTKSADKALYGAEESEGETTSKGIAQEDNLKNETADNIQSLEKQEEEGMELVRFQYDGELKIDVGVKANEFTDTNHCKLDDYDEASSLHVLKYMEPFIVTVTLKYEIIENEVYCDIMDDDMKLNIVNQVGIDHNEGFDEFLKEMKAKDEAAAKLLEKCSNTGCQYAIKHEEDENGVKSKANVMQGFATGRPNIASPYAKYMIFSVQGGTATAVHKAAFIVEGYFSKGPGNSFALPTHKPIMVLYDPPGGLSYATYENVQTTIKLETSSTSTELHHHLGMEFKTTTSFETDICVGLGAAKCDEILVIEQDNVLFGYSHDLGGPVQKSDKSKSTQFTTTWSYSTSTDPWTAGAMSDVFVIPNLNVMYREVYAVQWTNNTCEVEETEGNTLPITTTINLKDEKNQPALSFFSRYHAKYVKLPELKRNRGNIERVWTKCNCIGKDKNFKCNNGTDKASCGSLTEQKHFLGNAIKEWEEYLLPKENFKKNSIVNWFKEIGSELLKDKNDLEMNKHSSALALPELLSNAIPVEKHPEGGNDNTNLEEVKRIQFAGGGSTFSMTLSKDKMRNDVGLSNWNGASHEYETTLEGPGFDDLILKVFGIGGKMNLELLNLNIHVMHESTIENTEEKSTSIGFTLGDDDPGDEFVVDLYYDEKFGTVIFDTVAGRSKCPHEVGTAAIEDPSLVITSYPSQNVFPDESMLFELEISNVGVGEESLFVLYAQHRDNEGSLKLFLDGAPFGDSREFSNILKDVSYKKTLVVQRGPRLYQYPPLDLVLESACEDASSQ